jgi:5-methylcytosine-specific restriction protein B
MLEEIVRNHLKHQHEQLLEKGQLPTRDKLREYYANFRDRFAPEKLLQLDGEELLNTIHAHGNRDSLVYWLEFKNDDEFPEFFGSIAGGSALKFGIYRRKETGAWTTGSPSDQKEISVADAINIARAHRDELVAGAKLLEELASDLSDDNYAKLQDRMDAAAPEVGNSAWGHKYYCLIYPDKLDDFHVEEFQRFHIRKMLQVPPARDGRYAAAGRYVSAAAELQIPLNHLTTTLNRTNGRPYKVWRVGTKLGGTDDIWPLMKDENCAAIGWRMIGDLSGLADDPDGKSKIRKQLEAEGDKPNIASNSANQISNFVTRVAEGDVVLAADGEQILGIGKVTGPYAFKATDNHGAPHRRPVNWLDTQTWKLPEREGLRSTVRQLNKYPVNLVEIEKRLFGAATESAPQAPAVAVKALGGLESIPGRIQAALERKGQVIVYGPPGTGKTYWASLAARQLAARAAFGVRFEELNSAKQSEVTGSDSAQGLVRACTFHPAYGYEDFIEGYRPRTNSAGQLSFDMREGIFKQLCEDAEKQPGKSFYLVIDEINRGDIPRIFGELITLLEKDKRGIKVRLPVSGEAFSVPKNIYLIGTMNTADRSIALLDTALRRRFGFIELMPDLDALGAVTIANSIPLGQWLAALNEQIRNHVRRDARNLQVGHAYLMESGRPVTDFSRFVRILAEDIFPLLEEYCYENYSMLRELLGQALVDEENQRIRDELFEPERRDDLIQALLAPFPEIATSAAVVAAEPVEPEVDSEEGAEENA